MTRPFAVVAMSGGVDSSVAAALLLEAGYRVEGATLRLWDPPRRDDRICSDHRDASRVATALGIPHTLIDQREAFERTVVAPFVAGYASGRTPSPCVACNGDFKLGVLLDWALARGADVVATGHYARLERRDGAPLLRRARDAERDQSYFLFSLRSRQLEHTVFPLGDLTKTEVRARAATLHLPVATKRDSQDLCFGDPAALVRARGGSSGPGEVVDEGGRRLGVHAGVERFTVGQRRGLGIAAARPLYVQALDAASRRVVVAASPPRACALYARDWNWTGRVPVDGATLLAQVRSRQPPLDASVCRLADGRVRVDFQRFALAAAPGQAVVVYRGDAVVGGGWIEQVVRAGEAA
jgi:tRNA-uridine 2-sulfurtransferase